MFTSVGSLKETSQTDVYNRSHGCSESPLFLLVWFFFKSKIQNITLHNLLQEGKEIVNIKSKECKIYKAEKK